MTGTKPVATLETCLYVKLVSPRTQEQKDSLTLVDDDGTIMAFLKWQQEHKVFPNRSMVVGPGIYEAIFDSIDAPAVNVWVRSRLTVE